MVRTIKKFQSNGKTQVVGFKCLLFSMNSHKLFLSFDQNFIWQLRRSQEYSISPIVTGPFR